jgi:hypothetical protein
LSRYSLSRTRSFTGRQRLALARTESTRERSAVQLRPPTTPYSSFDGMTRDEIMDYMERWFFDNFEEPSADSDGKFSLGGPYSAMVELYRAFASLNDDTIDEVVRRVNYKVSSGKWAPHQNRVYEEGGRDKQYENMQRSLDGLEAVLDQVAPVSARIGDNRPPENVGVPPYNESDERTVREIIEKLRASAEELASKSEEVAEAAEDLRALGHRIRQFLGEQGRLFADEFSKEAGKRVAQLAMAAATWQLFGDKLMEVCEAVNNFLKSIGLT